MSLTAVQTTMTTTPASGAPGMLYDDSEACDIIHRVASVDIPFGAFVKVDADVAALPAASADATGIGRGIALQDPGKATTDGYKAGDIVAVLVRGRVWVQLETGQSLSAYAVPYARYTANGGLTVGGLRSDTDTGKAAVPNGAFMFSSTVSGLGVLQLGDPQAGAEGPTA